MDGELIPRRIVSLQPSATVMLDHLGALDRLIACTRYCAEVCPSVRDDRIIVADSWTAKSEQILAAQPDLVIASVPYQTEAVTEILKSGARFLGLAPRSLRDIYVDRAILAGIVGAYERGDAVIQSMRDSIEEIRIASAEVPTYSFQAGLRVAAIREN